MTSSNLINKKYFNKDFQLKPSLNNNKNIIQFKESQKQLYEIATESNSYIRGFQISNSSCSLKTNKSLIFQIISLSKEQLIKQYNCTPTKFNSIIINNLIRNNYCHIVTIFKDILLNNSNNEFIQKYYKRTEINKLIKSFYPFYKNYLQFYCKPIFSCISESVIMKDYYNKKAKFFLCLNNYEENSNIIEANISNCTNNSNKNKTIETLSDSQNFFNYKIRETLENITIISNTPDKSEVGTINLNMSDEKFEVFRENKNEYSNNTTFEELMKYIKNNKKAKEEKIIPKNKIRNNLKNVLLALFREEVRRNSLKINLKNNKNNLQLNNICFNSANLRKTKNKTNIPIIKINTSKLKLNNKVKKIKKNIIEDNINRSTNYQIKLEHNNRNNNSSKNNDSLNLNSILIKNSKNKINNLIINKSINNNINDNKIKEKINNNNNTASSIKKNIKNINKTIPSILNIKHGKENSLINKKILFKNKKKLSRNKFSSYQTISILKQNSEYSKNIKDSKLSSHQIIRKTHSNSKKKPKHSKIKIAIPNQNHVRHKTKIIKSQNIENIFKSIYSNLKKTIPNNYIFNTIHIDKSHNYNQNTLLNNLKTDNNTNSRNAKNSINYKVNIHTNKTAYYSSIYNERSHKSIKNNEISKIGVGIKSNKNRKKNFSLNFNKNSFNNISNNKTNSFLSRTYENNNLLYNNAGNSFEKNMKTFNKNRKNSYNGKLRTINIRKNKINSVINNDSMNIHKKQKMFIKENKNNINTNSINNKRNYKTFRLKKIFNSKILLRNIEEKNIKKNKNDFSGINFSYNLNQINNKDIKGRLTDLCKNHIKFNNIFKNCNICIEHNNFIINNKVPQTIIKSYHNRNQTIFGI